YRHKVWGRGGTSENKRIASTRRAHVPPGPRVANRSQKRSDERRCRGRAGRTVRDCGEFRTKFPPDGCSCSRSGGEGPLFRGASARMPFLEPRERSPEHDMIDPIDFSALADPFQQGNGQVASDVFSEFIKTMENLQPPVRPLAIECAMPRW